jgi:hypothetical protein
LLVVETGKEKARTRRTLVRGTAKRRCKEYAESRHLARTRFGLCSWKFAVSEQSLTDYAKFTLLDGSSPFFYRH